MLNILHYLGSEIKLKACRESKSRRVKPIPNAAAVYGCTVCWEDFKWKWKYFSTGSLQDERALEYSFIWNFRPILLSCPAGTFYGHRFKTWIEICFKPPPSNTCSCTLQRLCWKYFLLHSKLCQHTVAGS